MSGAADDFSEELFGEDVEPAPRKKKRGPLFWVLGGCGCGCLGLALLAGAGLFLFYRTFERGTRDDVKWPALDEVLAYDERPEEVEVEVYFELFGYEQLHLRNEALGLTAVVNVYEDPADADVLFDPNVPAGFGGFDPDDLGTATVQGREVRYVVFDNMPDEDRIPDWAKRWVELPDPETAGTTLRADLSDDRRGRVLDLGRSGSEPLTPADLQAFLEPFDVWDGR